MQATERREEKKREKIGQIIRKLKHIRNTVRKHFGFDTTDGKIVANV